MTPLLQSIADEALIRYAINESDFHIHVTIAPLPITKVEKGFGKAEDAFSAWFLVVISFPFISGAFASFIVTERQSKAKHLQTVAGVKPSAYWLSTFLWDIMNYQIPLWVVVALMHVFDVHILTTNDRGVHSGVIALLILYGPASAAFTYCVSFAFSSASLCNMVVIITSFLIGMGGPITNFILTLLANEPGNPRPNFLRIVNILEWCLRFIPSFGLGKGLFHAINIDVYAFLEGDIELSAWSEPVLGLEVVFLGITSIVYIALAILLDYASSNPRFVEVIFVHCYVFMAAPLW